MERDSSCKLTPEAQCKLPANATTIQVLTSQICNKQFGRVEMCSTRAKHLQQKQPCDVRICFPFAGTMYGASFVIKMLTIESARAKMFIYIFFKYNKYTIKLEAQN